MHPATVPYTLTRIGTLMAPEPGNPLEEEGVLNPATARTPGSDLLIFPRMVARGNFSRIGRARVVLDRSGVPTGVRREGIALAPERSWERGHQHGGTEDPRITWLADLGLHVMTYVAYGPSGPRTALAVSPDLAAWQRLGPLLFDYDDALDTDLNLYPNKDVVYFPHVVPAPDGTPSYAALHRPYWDLGHLRDREVARPPSVAPDGRPSIWISYVPARAVRDDVRNLVRLGSHRFVAGPQHAWEAVRIGAGAAPIRVDEGWLVLHHGVHPAAPGSASPQQQTEVYAAGAMILDAADPSRVLARSAHPLLEPATADETTGTVSNVVFPTAAEQIHGVTYVFYGMADAKIGLAVLSRSPG